MYSPNKKVAKRQGREERAVARYLLPGRREVERAREAGAGAAALELVVWRPEEGPVKLRLR